MFTSDQSRPQPKRTRKNGQPSEADTPPPEQGPFDYAAAAELFSGPGKKGRNLFAYQRFDSAAEALRFAIERMPPATLQGAYLEVDEARFGVAEIRALYESSAYPLQRSAT